MASVPGEKAPFDATATGRWFVIVTVELTDKLFAELVAVTIAVNVPLMA